MNSRVLFCVVAVALTIGCQSTAKPVPSSPAALPLFPDSVKWVQQAAEYTASVLQTYRAATARVEREAGARSRDTWAVILDADETVISNATYQAERGRHGLAYSTDSWHAWVVRRESTPFRSSTTRRRR